MSIPPVHTASGEPPTSSLYLIGSIGIVRFSTVEELPKRTLGGAGFNIGVAAAANHVRPSIITTVSESDAKLLAELPLDTICDTTYIKTSPRYRLTFNYKTRTEALSEPSQLVEGFGYSVLNQHIRTCLSRTGWYHISCRDPLCPKSFIEKLKANSRNRISIDFTFSSIAKQFHAICPLVQYVDLIFLNEPEYELIRNKLSHIRYKGIVIVTRREHSAQAWYRGLRILDVKTAWTEPVDPSGAGDCFTGAFLASISRGKTLADAMVSGHRTARKSLSNIGVEALLQERESLN